MEITITEFAKQCDTYPSLIRDIITDKNLTTSYKLNPDNNKKCRFIDEETCKVIMNVIEQKNKQASKKKEIKNSAMDSTKLQEAILQHPLVTNVKFLNTMYFPECQSFNEWFKEFMEDAI